MRSRATAFPAHLGYSGGFSSTTMIDTGSQNLGPGGLRQHHIDYKPAQPGPNPRPQLRSQSHVTSPTPCLSIDMNTFTTNHAAGPVEL